MLRLVKPPKSRKKDPDLLPPGTIIAEFVVEGDAVPWRAPAVMKGIAISPKHVKAWKEKVALAAHESGFGEARGIKPYGGPVSVWITFLKGHKSKSWCGRRWVTRPDLDNLCKGLIDSVTGNVFKARGRRKKGEPKVSARNLPPSPIGRVLADDNQCADLVARKRYAERSCVFVTIRATDPEGEGPI
jgi:Holliday junction resolvase RusA-like endonuclease